MKNLGGNRCFIGLGSNLGPRSLYIKLALRLLNEIDGINVVRCSRFYETEPVGIESKYNFINAVAELRVTLLPEILLSRLLEIEQILGRDRTKGQDRTIDLDILWYEGVEINTDELCIPHPRIGERGFVLVPWSDLAPDLHLVSWNKTISELLNTVKDKYKIELFSSAPQLDELLL